MMNMDCPLPTATAGVYNLPGIISSPKPVFELCHAIPEGMSGQIQEAVKDFVETSHSCKGVDPVGLYLQTLETIAGSTYLGGSSDFWLGTDNQGVCAYALARVVRDIDNRLTYWCSQSWMRKDIRGLDYYKFGMEKIRERAKNLMCSHIIIVSSRNAKAYLKFLGDNWNEYATLLKEDL